MDITWIDMGFIIVTSPGGARRSQPSSFSDLAPVGKQCKDAKACLEDLPRHTAGLTSQTQNLESVKMMAWRPERGARCR